MDKFRKKILQRKTPYILGVCGGSGSGKTTLAKLIHQNIGLEHSSIIAQDSYYIDQSEKFDVDGGSVNFDHPSSLDFKLLARHLMELSRGQTIDQPIYDFSTHKRITQTKLLHPKPLIIVDGTLILHAKEVNQIFSTSVFIQTAETLRFERRLNRDVKERGRTIEGVKRQFIGQVKPMHDQFVEPSSKNASITLQDEDMNDSLVALLKHINK